MSQRVIQFGLAVMLLSFSFPVEAQQTNIPTIGWLGSRPSSTGGGRELFARAFRALGHVEGKNFTFEFRNADNKLDRLTALADELIRLKLDVLFTPGSNEALAAKKATKTIPIVFAGVADPVAMGLVDSLAPLGGNITGVTSIASVLIGERLELLKETIPRVSRVDIL